MKRTSLLLVLSLLLLPSFALAGKKGPGKPADDGKYTFVDVVLEDGTVIEIEAAVKDTKKNDHSRCDYFSDDYVDWLGAYEEPVAVGPDADTVLAFCVDHFDDRSL